MKVHLVKEWFGWMWELRDNDDEVICNSNYHVTAFKTKAQCWNALRKILNVQKLELKVIK